MVEQKHEMDRLADLVDPEKNLIRRLGILAIEIDEKIAAMLPSLREPSGIIVVARVAGSASETPLMTGDVIHAINGSAVSTIEGLRSWLDNLKPESPIALQIERDGNMTFLAFQLE